MKAFGYPEPLRLMVDALKGLPGIGPRSAERIAVWLASKAPKAKAAALAEAAGQLHSSVVACRECGFFAAGDLCEICASADRDRGLLCVVEDAPDVISIERTGCYQGLYHVLGGRLSPLDGIGPEDLRIGALARRVEKGGVREIIFAMAADVEGEATASFLREMLQGCRVVLSRIAHGIPAGTGLGMADRLTLERALSGRRVVE
ncbi:MAG: recombination mediator RecR [Verrucomicrobiia bacterium]